MQTKMFFRLILAITVLAGISLGCAFIQNITEGVKVVGTGQAMVTDISAFSTEILPGIGETAQAMITEVEISGVLETAQSAITEQAPGLGETVQAAATDVYTSPDQAPEDIPIMAGETNAFVGTPISVSYFINAEIADVVAFYKREMPVNGWQEQATNAVSSDNLTQLEYRKGDRSATVVITQVPFVGQTTVLITIEKP